MRTTTKFSMALALIVAAGLAAPVVADPPDHAPAHGWRRKQNNQDYEGYEGKHWDRDYAVLSGRCDRHAVATAIGGVVGGVIGSQVAQPENRTIATIVGAAVGALIGNLAGGRLRRRRNVDQRLLAVAPSRHVIRIGAGGGDIPGQNRTYAHDSRATAAGLAIGFEVHRQRILQAAAAGIPQVLTFGHTKGASRAVWVERFRRLGPIARDNNVTVVVKQHGGETGTGEACAAVTREVNHPNVKVNYDAGNVLDYLDKDPIPDIRACAAEVRSFCVKDHRNWPRDEDCGPGFGEIDHYRLLHPVAFTGLTMPLADGLRLE